MVRVVGEATTEMPEERLNVALGAQVYVLAPVPVNVLLLPEQILYVLAVTPTVGFGFTVTTTVPVPGQVEPKPLTV